jgi:hypothetical protein
MQLLHHYAACSAWLFRGGILAAARQLQTVLCVSAPGRFQDICHILGALVSWVLEYLLFSATPLVCPAYKCPCHSLEW